MSTEFVTCDPERAHARITAAYADTQIRLAGDLAHFRLRQTRTDLGDVRIDTFANSLTCEYTVDPLGCLLIARVVDGQVELGTDHPQRQAGPGDAYLVARPDTGFATRHHRADLQLVGLNLSLFRAVVDDPHECIARMAATPLPACAGRYWQDTVDYVLQTVLANEDAAASPLVLGAAGQLLATSALTALGGTPAERRVDRADAALATVRRAVAYMQANPHLDIGVADVARAAHVGVRAVQLAFRRHLDTTPTAYLRRVRLERAHRDLLRAGPSRGDSVTAIAARWGFAHLGRFAAEYRKAYGQSPHLTLQR